MQDLNELDLPELIDLLAGYTERLTKLLQEKNRNEEYLKVKQTIKKLAAEIQARKSADVMGQPVSRGTAIG